MVDIITMLPPILCVWGCAYSALLLELGSPVLALLLLRLALLQERLWWEDLGLGWDRTAMC